MTINDILQMNYVSANEKQLRQAVQQLADAANKRVRRGMQQESISPAIATWQRQGKGMFSPAGKNLNQLRSEFKRIKMFLEDKTSTRRGQIRYQKEVLRRIRQQTGIDMDKEQARSFFDALNKVKEVLPLGIGTAYGVGSDQIVKWAAEMFDEGKGAEEIISGIEDRINEIALEHEFAFDGWGM